MTAGRSTTDRTRGGAGLRERPDEGDVDADLHSMRREALFINIASRQGPEAHSCPRSPDRSSTEVGGHPARRRQRRMGRGRHTDKPRI